MRPIGVLGAAVLFGAGLAAAVAAVAVAATAAAAAVTVAPAAGGFTTFDNPSGGRLITGALPASDTSAKAALIDMLRRAHAYFGARPVLAKVVVAKGGLATFAFFSETTAHGKVLGLILAADIPGKGPHGALLFDRAERFRATIGPLMQHLADLEAIANGGAPALPLTRQRFRDGSGSVGVPAGWVLRKVGEGSFQIVYPHAGTPMSITAGGAILVIDPRGQAAANDRRMRRFDAMHAIPPPPPPKLPQAVLLPDPVGDLLAIENAWGGGSGFRLLRVLQEKRLPIPPQFQTPSQPVARWYVRFEFVNPRGIPMEESAIVQIPRVLPPMGLWTYSLLSDVRAPVALFARFWPTAMAIMASVKLNEKVIAAEMRAQNRLTNAMAQQNSAALTASHNAFMAQMQSQFQSHEAANQAMTNATHAGAQYFIHSVIQGSTVFRNTQTGQHYLGPSGMVSAMTRANPRLYQAVPLRSYIPGVDY